MSASVYITDLVIKCFKLKFHIHNLLYMILVYAQPRKKYIYSQNLSKLKKNIYSVRFSVGDETQLCSLTIKHLAIYVHQ